ncbi:MAG: class I SAM-dependent methyltransferase [Planctomycetaceae bacterium]
MKHHVDCYDVPEYWDLAFDEDTSLEADFLIAAANKYGVSKLHRLFEPGCGGGRLLRELAGRGFQVCGVDQSSTAVEFAKSRLGSTASADQIVVGDMRTWRPDEPVDLAYCLVNTFRHLLTEDDAVQHLQTVSASLIEGGLYILGLHLLPPDADEEDDEEWSVTKDGTTVNMRLDVTECSRILRQETLSFRMEVIPAGRAKPLTFTSEYPMRIYEADQLLSLLRKVPAFRLRDVYDFWYDIEEPLTLSDEMGDTVLVLQKGG